MFFKKVLKLEKGRLNFKSVYNEFTSFYKNSKFDKTKYEKMPFLELEFYKLKNSYCLLIPLFVCNKMNKSFIFSPTQRNKSGSYYLLFLCFFKVNDKIKICFLLDSFERFLCFSEEVISHLKGILVVFSNMFLSNRTGYTTVINTNSIFPHVIVNEKKTTTAHGVIIDYYLHEYFAKKLDIFQFFYNNNKNNSEVLCNFDDTYGFELGIRKYVNYITPSALEDIERYFKRLMEKYEKTPEKVEAFVDVVREKKNNKICRFKFFFDFKYCYKPSNSAKYFDNGCFGVRKCKYKTPEYVSIFIETYLVKSGILQKNQSNFTAFNYYVEQFGELGQHKDDLTRFNENVVTLRLYNSAPLAFNMQYGYTDPLFEIEQERGAVLQLHSKSFAMCELTHCIARRYTESFGFGSLIVREIYSHVVNCVNKLDKKDEMKENKLKRKYNEMQENAGEKQHKGEISKRSSCNEEKEKTIKKFMGLMKY